MWVDPAACQNESTHSNRCHRQHISHMAGACGARLHGGCSHIERVQAYLAAEACAGRPPSPGRRCRQRCVGCRATLDPSSCPRSSCAVHGPHGIIQLPLFWHLLWPHVHSGSVVEHAAVAEVLRAMLQDHDALGSMVQQCTCFGQVMQCKVGCMEAPSGTRIRSQPPALLQQQAAYQCIKLSGMLCPFLHCAHVHSSAPWSCWIVCAHLSNRICISLEGCPGRRAQILLLLVFHQVSYSSARSSLPHAMPPHLPMPQALDQTGACTWSCRSCMSLCAALSLGILNPILHELACT